MSNATPTQTTILEPEVKIMLGGHERTLRLDFNALALIEERTGKSIMQMGDWQSLKTKDLRSMVWAALVHEDASLTETQVGAMLTMSSLATIMSAFGEAMFISMKGERPTPATIAEGQEATSPLVIAPEPV